MKPLIGISPTPREADLDHGHFRSYTLSDTYSSAILAAGGIPVILPAHPELIDDMLDTLDGVIFSGGGDIDPSYWNEKKHPAADGFDEQRDTFELQAIPKVIARDMPMLGICRGIQTINVARGGSLYQDIPDQVADSQQHRQHNAGKMRDERFHSVTIDEGENPLRAAIGDETAMVNSFHHQAIKDVGEGLEVIARSDDGVIEAMWLPEMTFGLAVQWHPEMLAAQYPDQARIFEAFVNAAAEKKSSPAE
ncbi:MAG TPA: gamma-glutamyl-gamma-aminobutyrate hydrolase family protein [Thermomicrobiales bacterium]|nr:gamma-glutamyl-gamma-aminobutyrate hydrolase family protein [Thermomicrobiales bacterium]